ncbi:MAG: NAD-dependent epimerase/dehydratase family protein, partial [Plesiomonas shigelloides]
MAILVTGGAGYIGSHTVLELLNSGNDVVIIDNLCNSSRESLRRVEALTGRSVTFYEADVCDRSALQTIFAQHAIDAVIHFAGLKAVGESTQIPLKYYQNNIAATLVLCEEMERAGVFRLVFSSSATVYGDPHTVPIKEHFPTSATNPYGRSKLMVEEMLRDIVAADPRWSVVLLRYFNPVGA